MNQILHYKSIKNSDNFGGKTKGLLQLIDSRLNVPNFYVISHDLLLEIEKNQQEFDKILLLWKQKFSIKDTQTFSVRSSASVEDGISKSFAGLFSTKLNCSTTDLKIAIINLIADFKNNTAILNKNSEYKYHIIIQEMIRADISGVIFSRNPTDIFDKGVFINIVPGSGEALVSGDVNGMTIRIEKNTDFLFPQDFYDGKNAENSEPISIRHDDLKSKISPFLKELTSKSKQLEKKFKTPIDIEFCIKNNQIFWLQMRPITTLFESQYYDNTGIGENYPGVSLPLTISFVKQSYYIGYSEMLKFLSPNNYMLKKNKTLLANMVGEINGVLYYNITNWQKLLYQLPFGKFTSKAITRLLAMQDANFEKPKRKFQLLNNPLGAIIFLKKSS